MCDIPLDLWAEFRKHRKLMKKPMTPYAEKLILGKLDAFEAAGHDPLEILNRSIENGWQGVFAPDGLTDTKPEKAPPWWSSDASIERKAGELGLKPRAGETWQQLKGRINEALAEN